MEALIAITYRCNARCHMCDIWKHQTRPEEEIRPEDLESLPGNIRFANITGGEPFLRKDIGKFVSILQKKTRRVVISTNGYMTDAILDVAKKNPGIGVRVSIEGLPKANDELRGIKDGFDHGIRTLIGLRKLGLKDIGFGITVSDRNADDLMELYGLAKWMGAEFATAATHNTFYFHKHDNVLHDREGITKGFKELSSDLLRSSKPKDWFRAYFNYGLANYVNGHRRLLPCRMGTDVFFMDPRGDVYPCNGNAWSMGNIRRKEFNRIWHGAEARLAREKVKSCTKGCWMIGSASPAIKQNLHKVLPWIIRGKILGIDWRKVG